MNNPTPIVPKPILPVVPPLQQPGLTTTLNAVINAINTSFANTNSLASMVATAQSKATAAAAVAAAAQIAASEAVSGVIAVSASSSPDSTPPPMPTGLVVTAGISDVFIQTDTPNFTQGHGYARTNVYAARVLDSADLSKPFGSAGVAGICTIVGPFGSFASNPSLAYRVWVTWVSKDGYESLPAPDDSGQFIQTGVDVTDLLTALDGQITASQLFTDLASPIAAIPGIQTEQALQATAIAPLQAGTANLGIIALQSVLQNDTVAQKQRFQSAAMGATMSVDPTTGQISLIATAPISSQVQQQLNQLSTNYNAVSGSITTLDQTVATTSNSVSSMQSQIQQLQGEVSLAVTAEYVATGINSALGDTAAIFNSAQNLALAALQNILNNDAQANQQLSTVANVALAQTKITATADAQQSQAQSIAALVATTNSNQAAIVAEATTRSNADYALSQQISTLSATTVGATNSLSAAIESEASARTNADNSLAQQINTLAVTVNTNNSSQTAAVQTEASARATQTGQLSAQYTIKVDVNGYVAGYGLASTANNATPYSSFAVRADEFYIASPTGPTIAPAIPFTVITTPTTINGQPVPVGVYMNQAFIANGTITSAQIGLAAIDDANIANLNASKLIAGSITAAQIAAGTITATQIAAGTITANQIAANTLTSNQIAAGSIVGNSIAAGTITAAQIAAGTITAAQIAAGAITGDRISGNTISADNIISSSASQFSSVSYSIPNGTWVSVPFTMAHSGVATVVGNFALGVGANYSSWDMRLGIDQQPSYSISSGGSQSPPPTIGGAVAAVSLGAGSHTVWLYAYASNATGNQSYTGLLLLSYR